MELSGGIRSGDEELDELSAVDVARVQHRCAVNHDRPLSVSRVSADEYPILPVVQTPDYLDDVPEPGSPTPTAYARPEIGGIWAAGERVTWVAGLVLMLSSAMGWYTGSGDGIRLAVIGWHTGVIGKLVFFVGLAVLVLVILRELGIELPPSIPESLVILALGALATVLVLVRVIDIPDSVLPADGRGVGLWVSLVAALGVIAGGILRAAEEL